MVEGAPCPDAPIQSAPASFILAPTLEILCHPADPFQALAPVPHPTIATAPSLHRSPPRQPDREAPIGDDAMSEFLRRQHREDKLLLGAAAQVEGLEVLPSEDPEAMETANP